MIICLDFNYDGMEIKAMSKIEGRNEKLSSNFIQLIENDLNQCVEWLPNVLEASFEEILEFRNYRNAFEFLVGLSFGKLQGKYLQVFQVLYEKIDLLYQVFLPLNN